MAFMSAAPTMNVGQTYRFGNMSIKPISANSPFVTGSSSSSMSSSGSGMLPERISPPSLTPVNFSSESTSYPKFLRNLGEVNAARGYRQELNRAQLGNAPMAAQRAFNNYNTARLGYMSQAGREDFAVQQGLAQQENEMNKLLAQMYGMDIQQRGQDVDYNAAMMRNQTALQSSGGGVMRLGGGGNSQTPVSKYTPISGSSSLGSRLPDSRYSPKSLDYGWSGGGGSSFSGGW